MNSKKIRLLIFLVILSSILPLQTSFAAEEKSTSFGKSNQEKTEMWTETAKKYGFNEVKSLPEAISDGYFHLVQTGNKLLQGSRRKIDDIKRYLEKVNQFRKLNNTQLEENSREYKLKEELKAYLEQSTKVSKGSRSRSGQNQPLANAVASQYKIHLMPTNKNIDIAFESLLKLIQGNERLQKLISSIKIRPDYEKTESDEIFPIIVLYITDGKENAQEALDILFKHFKDFEGLGLTPRYNARVTDMIYFAQGDGDLKNKYPDLFEKPFLVYYDASLIKPAASNKNHYLKHPETKEDIK